MDYNNRGLQYFLVTKKAIFVLQIVTDDEKWIYNPKRKKLWISPG